MARTVDLYSDTTTRPSLEMRQAMAAAEVGDEQRGTDPTVLKLQQRVADLLGKEAALFLPSTTMANQIAIKLHTDPGDEVILEATSHPTYAEAGGAGLVSGAQLRGISGNRGLFSPADVETHVFPDQPRHRRSRLLWVENTHNMGGGTVWPLDQLREVAAAGRRLGLSLHLDGARLMNAAVKSGVAPQVITAPFDTVSFCITKGLGAPVGGLLAADAARIEKAKRIKHGLGGSMRQSGVIASAGLYALDNNVKRLAEDHRRARELAEGLLQIPKIKVDIDAVETNMVFFQLPEDRLATEFAHVLDGRGVMLSVAGPRRLRAVTHLDVDDEDIEYAVEQIASTLRDTRP